MRRHIIKFIRRGITFCLLFICLTSLIIIIPSYVFYFGNEHIPIDKIISLQKNSKIDILYGKAYSNEQSLYKLKLINSNKCEVISLGTSRVMQFRSHFFNDSFCNAGGGIYNINDAKEFLENVDKKKLPKLIILELDQNFFHEKSLDDRQSFKETKWYFLFIPQNTFKIYLDILNKKINFSKLRNERTHIGLTAIMRGDGFRKDGSYFYNDTITKNESVELRIASTLNNVRSIHGYGRFIKNVEFDNESLGELKPVLDLCKNNNIQVIGFLPPFAKEVWSEIEKYKENYQYMFKIEKNVKPLFETYGYDFYDFSDLDDINAPNCEIIDDLHGSEKAYLRILIRMAETNNELLKFVDLNYLNRKLAKSEGCFLTYNPSLTDK
ncbi:MAG: hypothetical protein ABIC04_06920 [Nanoarchaeota archaeon]